MKNEIYSVAYNDKYDNGFSKIEPWIISDFGNDLKQMNWLENGAKMSQFLNAVSFQK